MATGELKDPYSSYNFHVEIDGISRGAFQEVSGLDSTIDIVEYREGGWNATPHKFPGQTKHANIVLKYGVASDRELVTWHQTVAGGTIDRRNGSVILLDRRGTEVARWNFMRAWPTKYTGPSFNAKTSDIAIDTIELAHEGLERVS